MKLKVCGLKYSDNIRQIAELNPDYMGFIFYNRSKRFVGEDFVMPEISTNIKKTGVFVNASEEYVLSKVDKYKLDYVQFHGDENKAYCEKMSGSVNVIKAFGIDDQFDLKILNDYKKHCKFFLFDTKTESFEGTGKNYNFEILSNYDNEVPYFVAGNMDIEKFRKIKELNLNIYGIDINSRLEIKPGYKDIIKVIQMRNNIR